MKIDELDFPEKDNKGRGKNQTRIFNCLWVAGIKTVEELCEIPTYKLLKIKDFGPTCLETLSVVVSKQGFDLNFTELPNKPKSPKKYSYYSHLLRNPDFDMSLMEEIFEDIKETCSEDEIIFEAVIEAYLKSKPMEYFHRMFKKLRPNYVYEFSPMGNKNKYIPRKLGVK